MAANYYNNESNNQQHDDNIEIITINPQVDKDLYQEEKNLRLEVLLLPTGRTEWWHRDHISKHIVAVTARSRVVVGCVLLVWGEDERKNKTAILCQMAVSESYRCQGIGRRLVAKCESIAREEGGIERIYLHARLTAAKFYENCGYVKQGSIFEEVGLLHIAMVKTLDVS